MDSSRTQKELAELATATAADVGYEALRWWIDEERPDRLRVQARSLGGTSSITLILLALLSAAESCDPGTALPRASVAKRSVDSAHG